MVREEIFPPGYISRRRSFELERYASRSYFRSSVLLISSVWTNCTGISTDLIAKGPFAP
jgi:hypothetical protein